jgi:hypothetical protein
MPSNEYFSYLVQAGLIHQFGRVRTCCSILGLNVDELTIDAVEQAWKTQLSSPGVHSDLAREMTKAKDTFVKWIEENPTPGTDPHDPHHPSPVPRRPLPQIRSANVTLPLPIEDKDQALSY